MRATACVSPTCRARADQPVYDEYVAELAETKPEDLAVCAVSIIGPRTKVGKLVTRLDLLIRPLPWPSPRRVSPPGQLGDHREVQCVGLGEVDPLGRMAIAQVQQTARSFVGDRFGGRGQRAHVQ
jgi:hypothetical protein